jgi:hypothetical protein
MNPRVNCRLRPFTRCLSQLSCDANLQESVLSDVDAEFFVDPAKVGLDGVFHNSLQHHPIGL